MSSTCHLLEGPHCSIECAVEQLQQVWATVQALLNKQPMRRPNCEQLLEHPFLAVIEQQNAQKEEAEERPSSRNRPQQQPAAQKQRPMAGEAKREAPSSLGSSGRAAPMAAACAAGAESQKAGQQRLDGPSGRHATSSLHVTWAYGLKEGYLIAVQEMKDPEVGIACRDLTLCACTHREHA